MKKILSLLVLLPLMVVGQTENYIKTTTYKVADTTTIASPTITQANQNITYFDGLGRPIQQIAHQQSGSGKDIVTPIEYDAYGRQTKDYLPYVPAGSASLDYKSTALTDVLNFSQYSGQNPYSEKEFEASPLNRVLKQAAPGNAWALNSGHEIKLDYQTNTTSDAVKLFNLTAYWDVSKGLYDIPTSLTPNDYQQFQLYKTITKDENWVSGNNNTTEEFKNKEGQVVLKRTYDNSIPHDTYYVYDQYGNLTFVIPPLVNASTTISNTILNDLCYQYKYDSRNRLVEKKLPGKQWEFIVYDKLDRVVATGPAFSPFSDLTTVGWLITKYDAFNRVVYTGWENTIATSTTRTSKQTTQNGRTTSLNEYKAAPGYIDGMNTFYSNTVAPTAFKLLTINYYDNYDFSNAPTFPAYSYNGRPSFYNNSTMRPKGMPAGSWTRVLSSSSSLAGETTYVLYDYKARPIRNYTANYLGGFTRTDIDLDFTGKTTYTYTTHKRSTSASDPTITISEGFNYTPQDRLLNHTHSVNSFPAQLLASNTYDELGQLISKKVGNTVGTPLQKVDYVYNIRGWLTEINKVNALQQGSDPKDLFGFKINYNTIEGFTGATKALYNGNIAETLWSNNADGGFIRAYGYLYDNLNRLKDATYYKTGSLPYVSKAYDENLTYDKNGNIMTLKRNGGSDVSAPPNLPLDDLVYTYAANSNKLLNVFDNSNNNTAGFVDENKTGDDYSYDANGNMITDKNKGIIEIIYNHLNLPTKITFGTKGTISYIYNSMGEKIEKTVYQAPKVNCGLKTTITTDYLSGFQYMKTANSSCTGRYALPSVALQFFPTAEGYVKNTNGFYSYVFNHTDHLGNVRLSYEKDATTGLLKILEENNYYPFGMKHSPSAVVNAQPNYKYKYNGKELQDELGLNMYDYGARNYDPALGRWMNIDPKAEESRRFSPYVYANDNPVFFIDPDGMSASPPDDIYVNTKTSQVSVIKTNDKNDKVIVDGNNTGTTEKGEYKSTYEGYKTNELKINYSSSANESTVSDYTTSVIVDVMNQSGESSIQINSTARSVEDQVKVMGDMVLSRGMAAQKKMYAAAGDKVLDKYPDRAAMLETAKTIGPSNVSKHCADLNKMNVVDVSPVNGGIKNAKQFSANAQSNPSVSNVLSPWTKTYDPAIHIEIPQK